ncbi:MAG: hypothetical protein KJ561_00085 [Nanoarchaeota archaeon]|nr:hypothetical protein [Nanoarchaeota archaeon]
MAFYLLRNSKKEILERMEYLISRCKSAFKNYADKDYKSVDYIIGNILEQLVFLILTEKNIQYASKKDAADLIKKLPEGKSIEKIKNMAGKQKIGQLEEFLIGLYASHLLGKNND